MQETKNEAHQSRDLMLKLANASHGGIFITAVGQDNMVQLEVKAAVKLGAHPMVQNFLAAVHEERGLLMELASGGVTDADRYRALRDYALLRTLDPGRFLKITMALDQHEQEQKVDLEAIADPADYDQYVTQLIKQLAETDPDGQPNAQEETPAPDATTAPQ
jgi:hypothetical protein